MFRLAFALLLLAPAGCFNPGESNVSDTDPGTTGGPSTTAAPTGNTAPATSVGPSSTSTADETSTTTPATSTTTMDTGTSGSSCGDGLLDDGEACDDANQAPGDGCDAACEVEEGWTCTDDEPTLCGAPDLAIQLLSATKIGNNLNVVYEVTNLGSQPSDQYRVDLWDTRSNTWNAPPVLGDAGTVAFADRPALDPGETDMFSDSVPNAPDGNHVAFAIIDTENSLTEEDENNNVSLGFAWRTGPTTAHITFPADEIPVEVPDEGSGAAVISVSFPGTGPEVWVSVNVTHPEIEDLLVEVISPSGSVRTLTQVEVSGANLQSATFNDDAASMLGDASAPYAGEFFPEGNWDFAPGVDGMWRVRVTDTDADGHVARINNASVTMFEFDP